MSERMPCQLVTGGSGFIGSCYVLQARRQGVHVVNLDKLTYAGNPANLAALKDDSDYNFVRGDIGNAELVAWLLETFQPDAVVNFAAESHVDRSIVDPDAFVRTNVLGTATLLRMAAQWWRTLPAERASAFRFLHVSTDEVYGTLQPGDPAFTEATPYRPNSPYSASKAASDHLARAFHETYGLPVLLTNCSNNYGPRQFPEKLIPLMICNALDGKPLPVYGKGANIRDWLHVEDHCAAIDLVLHKGKVGEVYNVGGNNEGTNIDIVKRILRELGKSEDLIRYVKDRPGHDRRYAIDANKIRNELGWVPQFDFESGIVETIQWYLNNQEWWERIISGDYQKYYEKQYGI